MKAREYQLTAIDKVRHSLQKGNKHICLMMCGGSGKSLVSKIILENGAKKGSRMGFFSFRKSLTEQIKTYGIPDCDIGTLQKFGKTETDMYDLVIYDEKDYHDTKLKNNIKSKYSITLSGFPTDEKGNVLDYDDIIEVIQFPELVELGFAKKLKVFSISTVDTSGLKKQGGGFHNGQSFELMDKSTVKKDIVNTYKKYCIGRKTLLFAIDTKHAESLKNEFMENGIKCETIHSKKKQNNIIQDFEDGKFDLLINVAMISIGVDIPCINTILFARPMASVPLFMQCVWRGTRKFEDDYCLILDCAEVLKRTEFHPMQRLDLTKAKQEQKQRKCKCGGQLEIFNKQIKDKSELQYTLVTYRRCKECNNTIIDEDIKVISIEQCEVCLQPIDRDISMAIKENKICFDYVCQGCGNTKTVREVLLTDAQLKEVEYNEVMSSVSWERVSEELKIECKKNSYNWRYSIRLMDSLKKKNKTAEESLVLIEQFRREDVKLAKLMYI